MQSASVKKCSIPQLWQGHGIRHILSYYWTDLDSVRYSFPLAPHRWQQHHRLRTRSMKGSDVVTPRSSTKSLNKGFTENKGALVFYILHVQVTDLISTIRQQNNKDKARSICKQYTCTKNILTHSTSPHAIAPSIRIWFQLMSKSSTESLVSVSKQCSNHVSSVSGTIRIFEYLWKNVYTCMLVFKTLILAF